MLSMICLATGLAREPVIDAEPSLLEVHYIRTQITDTTRRSEHFLKDPVMLRVGKTKSLFCGSKRLLVDSLRAVNPDLEFALYRQTMDNNRQNGTHNLPSGYYGSYIYKNYPEGKVTEKCHFDMEQRQYEEEWEKPRWEISDSSKNILGYECFKATTEFRGRHWTAWFAPEIPLSDGPWKLCGLPGVILEAYDSYRDYSFTATAILQEGLSELGFMTYDERKGVMKSSRDKFFNSWWRFKNSNFAAKMNAMYGNPANRGNVSDNKAPLYDAEETDYPHDL